MRKIDGPRVIEVMYQTSGTMPVFCLVASRATYGLYRPQLHGPFRWVKNGPFLMRRPGCSIK